jgi:UDP-N-acetylglucosamine:LPS N-acetylglucosamine transferase
MKLEMSSTMSDLKIALITVPGGGFYWEAMQLREKLAKRFTLKYVTVVDFYPPDDMPFPASELHHMDTVTTLSKSSRLARMLGFMKGFLSSFRVIRATRPDVLICIGSSMSVPLSLWAKVFRIHTYYVESIARVDHLSQTCRIMLKLKLARRIYVQWPDMVNLHPGVTYAGSVL